MREDIAQLKQRIKDLESELEVSLAREEIKNSNGRLKNVILRTSIGRIAADPNSTVGKAIRFPRTLLRIIAYPHLIKEIYNKNKKQEQSTNVKQNTIKYSDYFPFKPLKIVQTQSEDFRVNLLLDSISKISDSDFKVLKSTLNLSVTLSAKFRLILISDSVDPNAFNKLLSSHKYELKNPKIEFYSLFDQAQKGNKKYVLETGNYEVFVSLFKDTNNEA